MAGTLTSAVSSRLPPAGLTWRRRSGRSIPGSSRSWRGWRPTPRAAARPSTSGPGTGRGRAACAGSPIGWWRSSPPPELARHVAAAYPDVRVIQAVGIRPGRHRRAVPARPAARESARRRWRQGPGTPITVAPADRGRVWTLPDVRFVKLDVEGHELPALRGAEGTVRRDRPLLLVEVEERIQPIEPVLSLLGGWGYRPYVMPGRRWLPLDDFDLVAHQRAAVGPGDAELRPQGRRTLAAVRQPGPLPPGAGVVTGTSTPTAPTDARARARARPRSRFPRGSPATRCGSPPCC